MDQPEANDRRYVRALVMDNAVESVIIAAIKQRMSMRSGNAC